MENNEVAELPGDTIAETPAKAEPITEGDGGANQHLLEAWNHLAMFIGSAEDEVEVGQAMALLAQMKILMSGMRVEAPELEDPNAEFEEEPALDENGNPIEEEEPVDPNAPKAPAAPAAPAPAAPAQPTSSTTVQRQVVEEDPRKKKKTTVKKSVRRPVTQRADLEQHMVCHLCTDRAFGTQSGLATHLKNLHGGQL